MPHQNNLVRFLAFVLTVLFGSQGLAQVNGNTGAYSTSIPIRVPSHRGLEPNLALAYSSLGGNGMVGVGWALTGFSVIERQGADGGAPQFNGTDSFRWNGEDLHLCGGSSSPGCLAGGTHFPEHESYQRIIQGAADWTVDSQNGTRSTYTPIFTVSSVTYRWGLSSVEDVLGNEVAYHWLCDTGKNCYPGDVTYNGYRVKFFYRDDRTDPFTFATGASLGETRKLLRSIKVELESGTPIRAYKLLYTTSGSTGRWLLQSVQMFGKDVVIDDLTGVITGGTSLPDDGFLYGTDASSHAFTGGGSWSQACSIGGVLGDAKGTGDFDGDGRQDIYCHDVWESGEIQVGLSSGSTFSITTWGTFCDGSDRWLSTGDYDGDGKTDFLCKVNYGGVSVALSTGSGLTFPTWSSGTYCKVDEGAFLQGDFDSDGKTDLGCHFSAGATPPNSIWIRKSTGTSFAAGTLWIDNWCRVNGGTSWGESWGESPKAFLPGDFDGDGNTDLLCRGLVGEPDGPWVALSNGSSGFTHDGAWTDLACGGSDQHGLGDFNGDGKTDMYCYDDYGPGHTSVTYVGLSDGSTFQTSEWLPTLSCQRFSIGDANGDSLTDVWCQSTNLSTFTVGLSDGKDAFSDLQTWKTGWCGLNKVVAGDFNGDAKMDLSCHTSTDALVALSGGVVGKTDIATTLERSLGATTSVVYVPGTQWQNDQVAPPSSLSSIDGNDNHTTTPSTHRLTPGGPTVYSVTVADGRGWSATSTYGYSGGLYDETERKWLGFELSTATRPKLSNETAGPVTVSRFVQNIAAAGARDYQLELDGTGKELQAVFDSIVTSGDGDTTPFTAKVASRTHYFYDGSGTDCTAWPCTYGERRLQEFTYDNHGNRTLVKDYGNVDAAGDETTTKSDFYPNTSAYVVNKPARTTTYFGIGTTGMTLTDSKLFYDGASVETAPPTQGLFTNRSIWLDPGNRWIPQCSSSACVEYDLFGNVTKVKESKWVNGSPTPVTAETLFQYETTYNQFPLSVTNALGHVSQTPDWDELCQAPETTVNPNLQQTATTYDELCRHDRTEGPLGSFLQSFYVNVGSPTNQYTETQTPSADGTGVYWTKSFFDGLGRSYQTESRSGEPGKNVLSGEVTFNERGQVATSALSRFTGESQFVRTPVYDVRDRVLEVRYNDPGNNKETYSYGLTWTAHANAQGHYTSSVRDATGLVRYFVEYSTHTPGPGGPIYTTSFRDVDDRTEYVQDDHGNAWATVFDSLGRAVTVVDPDSGGEIREYYDSGELKATTNSLNERTELEYDQLGRLAKKTTRKGAAGEQVTTFTYDQPRASYFNLGFLTRMNDSAGYREDDYDALGRASKTLRNLDSQNHVFEFFYNTAGLPSSRKYPDNDVLSWTYDGGGNLETETGTIASSEYDAARRLKTRSFQNGVVSTYDYSDTRGWIETIDTVKSSTVIQDLTYAYFPDGMVQSVVSAKPGDTWSWTYAYDDLNRLVAAANSNPSLSQGFTYDDIGNVTGNSQIGPYTYPATGTAQPHAVSAAGPRSYSYNAIGQMTNRNGTIIQWNGDGKPFSIGGTSFVYDGLGVRLKKTTGSQTTRYLGGDYEIAPDGTITKYLQGGKKVGAQVFMHHRDHLGSIQSVTDAAGVEVRGQKHKPFGDQFGVTGSHAESKGWIGEREEETELVYLNARYYDPEVARFVSPDLVVRLGQGLNRFSYAWNNPTNLRDPNGLDPVTDPCAGMTTEQCGEFLNNNGQNTFKGNCELNPYCSGFVSDDPSLWGWLSENEMTLWQILENNYIRGLLTTVDCTQPGANCEDPAASTTAATTGTTTTTTTTTSTTTGTTTTSTTTTTTTVPPSHPPNTTATTVPPVPITPCGWCPDAFVISGSVSAFSPYVLGAGTGREAVYLFDTSEWSYYKQTGVGGGTLGVSGSLTAGPIWNMPNADAYLDDFHNFSLGSGPIGPSGSLFGWEPWQEGSPYGFALGVNVGTPGWGGGYLWETYEFWNPPWSSQSTGGGSAYPW